MSELIIALVISIIINIFLGLYLRWLLKNFKFLSENTYNLLETAETFSNHLSAVYELETFYGDQTLQNLLMHTKQVVEEIKIYKDVYTLASNDEEIGDLFNVRGSEFEKEEETEEE